MKTIDFSHEGGFPLTQRELQHLQQAYTECITAIAAMGAAGSPVILWGMEASVPSAGHIAVSAGCMLIDGVLVLFEGGEIEPASGEVPMIVLDSTITTLTYYNGSTHPALAEDTAALAAADAGTASPTRLLYSSLERWHTAFGLNGRENIWQSISVATSSVEGNVVGTIYYKKNRLTGMLHLRATLSANHPSGFEASPNAQYYVMGTLPTGYRPANMVYFTAYYQASNLFKDDAGISWVKHLTAIVNTAGQIMVNFIKPDAAITGYGIMWNAQIGLD